jgi:hypothetical protein
MQGTVPGFRRYTTHTRQECELREQIFPLLYTFRTFSSRWLFPNKLVCVLLRKGETDEADGPVGA